MRVAGADAAGLHVGGARGVYIKTRAQCVVDRIADFESVEQVLRFSRARARDVQAAKIVLHHLRQRRQALLQKVRIGNGNVADFARGYRFALRGVLRVDLVWLGRDLHLLVQFL